VEALRKLSQYHLRMCKKAATFGMNLPSEMCNLFEFLDETDAVIESRYIRTGSKNITDNQPLKLIRC